MPRGNVSIHKGSDKHQQKLSEYIRTRNLKASLGLASASASTDSIPAQDARCDLSTRIETSPSPHSNDLGGAADEDVPISDLWTPVFREITVPEEALEDEPQDEDHDHGFIRGLESDNIISIQLPSRLSSGASEELLDDDGDTEECSEEQIAPSLASSSHGIPDQSLATYPWPSQSMFLTQLLFSGSSRLRFSETQKKAILEWAKCLGAPEVPALHTLKKVQKSIEGMVCSPTEKVVSSSGTVFYINEVARAIASVSGFFIPDRFFTRMVPAMKEGELQAEKLFALGFVVNKRPDGFAVDSGTKIIIPTESFQRTFGDLQDDGVLNCGFASCSTSYEGRMPHPRRAQAKGRMVYGVPLIIFLDDVSGNISKQWNKHHAIYMSNGLLPRQMIEKEFCTRFVTSSPHATPMELVKALKDSIARAADSGVEAYDCKHHDECLLVPHAHFWGSDNPMQAEECSHGGLKCNYFCRMCEVGGTQEQKRSDEGFLALFQAGTERTPEKTAALIHEQLRLSALHGATDKLQKHKATTGVGDSTCATALQAIVDLGKALYGNKNPDRMSKEDIQAKLEQEVERVIEVYGINPLIGMPGVNMHKDTPTEILHTILLGAVKYFWGQTVHILEKNKGFGTFQIRLASVDESGLNIPKLSAEYICAYKGSLIGKHFKSLAQLMPFLIYDLVPRKVLDAWSIIGELVVLVWHTQINDLEGYLAKLSSTIQAFLNITAECSPSILISKPKFHFLVHLPAHIRRFGPALIFSTERYESFNHVFRLSCIYSNRQAPSRDSCMAFASQDITKHIVTGGYWRDPSSRKWVHAGGAVLYHMQENKIFRRLLAVPEISEADIKAGGVKLASAGIAGSAGTTPTAKWEATKASNAFNVDSFSAPFSLENGNYLLASSFRAANGDQVHPNDFVAFHASGKIQVAQTKEILVRDEELSKVAVVTLDLFDFLNEPHDLLRMPVLRPSNGITQCQITGPSDILCTLNVQHDCSFGNCTNVKRKVIYQERLETSRSQAVVDHTDLQQFILNTHSLHNHSIISKLLPSSLTIVLSRPSLPPDEQNELRLRAASHIRNQKSQENDNGQNLQEVERLPFETSSRGTGGRGGGGRGHVGHSGLSISMEVDGNPDSIAAMQSQLGALKNDELRERCKAQSLPTSGVKAALVTRLIDAARKASLSQIIEPGPSGTKQGGPQLSLDSQENGNKEADKDGDQVMSREIEDTEFVIQPGSEGQTSTQATEHDNALNDLDRHIGDIDLDGDHFMQPIAAPAPEEVSASTLVALEGLRRTRLAELCKMNSLAKSGTKAELIARLRFREQTHTLIGI
ncbi:hypothetical protein PM082_020136 [Marasmius tenuissimus]|nr:hypothetical protein PM082_020136 [Marasmius tenuissimus]